MLNTGCPGCGSPGRGEDDIQPEKRMLIVRKQNPKLNRRGFLKASLLAAAGLALQASSGCSATRSTGAVRGQAGNGETRMPVPAGTLDPTTIARFVTQLPIPAAMPRAKGETSDGVDHYEVAMRQFEQQILPPPHPKTAVWGYGAVGHPSSFR